MDSNFRFHEQAIRLSPRDTAISIWYQWIGDVHLLQSHTDEAILWLEKARHANPAHPLSAAGSPLLLASKARPNAPSGNSPKPGG